MIHFLIVFTAILLIAYALLIYYYHRIWDQIPSVTQGKKEDQIFKTRVSVIIPARNEAFDIGRCLDSLMNQSYPAGLTEIIVVNDFSTDETEARVLESGSGCTLLNLSDFITHPLNSYKKKALETGIGRCSGELILCTDADCTMGPEWISTLVSEYELRKPVFMAAPVKINTNGSILSVFQALDFISLQGITGSAVYKNLYPMCNGANLAYTREAYEAVGDFQISIILPRAMICC